MVRGKYSMWIDIFQYKQLIDSINWGRGWHDR